LCYIFSFDLPIFGIINPIESAVTIVMGPDGRPTGEAMAGFNNESDWTFCKLKHKQHMGKRYVEVYERFAKINCEKFSLKIKTLVIFYDQTNFSSKIVHETS
jgi:hypothetical protein